MLNRNSDTFWWARAALFFAFSVPIGCFASAATTITTFSPQGEVAQVRQVRATFSESMVPFGDLRQPDPFTVQCSEEGTGRWADDKSWAFDFKRDLPPGTRCTIIIKPGLKSVAGNAVSGKTTFNFNTGGPAIVRSYPSSGRIEEGQYFALLLNGAADAASVERFAYCTAGGISERIGVSLVDGAERDAILKTLRLSAMADRTVTLRCKQTLPHGADMTLVWARGIATPTGVANSADRHLPFKVQDDFTASFTCERENAHADCLPIRPLRVEFSAPISREQAERIVLSAPDGKHKATFEHNRGEEAEGLFSFVQRGYRKTLLFFGRTAGTADADPSASGVTAVEFPPSFPEAAAITIEIPADLHDESNRPLSNAGLFPIRTKTAVAPPIVKFAAAPFGILELNAQPPFAGDRTECRGRSESIRQDRRAELPGHHSRAAPHGRRADHPLAGAHHALPREFAAEDQRHRRTRHSIRGASVPTQGSPRRPVWPDRRRRGSGVKQIRRNPHLEPVEP